ncbi:MAG: DoxX family protein [Bacteroidales bacterium]|nr:DoxX family protein [Bacteroidales bacterium]
MKELIKILFPVKQPKGAFSLMLLSFRILFGIVLMTHGLEKLSNFSQLSESFPDPLGLTSRVSLGLAIFGEVACSLAFVFGFLYRLVLIPMIFTMGVAFFIIHGGDPFADRELAFVYMVTYIILYFPGPGKYSVDYWLGRNLPKWLKIR